jgi:hypothetical protein
VHLVVVVEGIVCRENEQTATMATEVESRNNQRGVAATLRRRLPRPSYRHRDSHDTSSKRTAILRLGGGGWTERWRRRRNSLLEFELR